MAVDSQGDKKKTKTQLIDELTELRRQVTELNAAAAAFQNEKDKLEAKYRSNQFIVNASRDFMTLINRDHIYEAANEAYCQAHQKSPVDIIGKSVAEVWGKVLYEAEVKEYLEFCLTGHQVRYQGWFEFATLGRRYFDVIYYPYYDQDRTVTHAVVVSRDNTHYKQIEEQLRRSEQRYRLVSDLTSNYTYAFSLGPEDEFLLEWVTDAFTRITDYAPEEVNTRPKWVQITHPDDIFLIDRREQALLSGHMNVTEFRIITKNGQTRWLRDHIRPIWSRTHNRVVRLFGAVQDITERKRAEAEREHFTNQLRTAAEVSRQLTAVLSQDQLLTEIVTLLQTRFNLYHVHVYLVDEAGSSLVLKAGSGEIGRMLQEQKHKLPLDQQQSLVTQAARTQELLVANDVSLEQNFLRHPLLSQTQSEVCIPLVVGDEILGVLDVQDDQINHFEQTDLDTFRILAGQIAIAIRNARLVDSLQLSEERYELAAGIGKVGVWDWDLQTNSLYLAPNLKAMLGYQEDDISNDPDDWLKHIHLDDLKTVETKIEAHLAGTTPNYSAEYRMLHQNGGIRWMLGRGMALRDEDGRPYRLTGANTDITELKEVQEALQYRIALEEFVTTMSTRFINLTADQIDDEINNALDIISKFFGVDCSYIAIYDKNQPEWQIRYQWQSEAVNPRLNIGVKMPVHEFKWSLDQLKQHEFLYIPLVSNLSPEAQSEQKFFESFGFETILTIPMFLNEAMFGLFGLVTTRGRKNWPSASITPLKLVSQMFVNILERKRIEEQVQASLQEKEILLKEIHHRVKNNLQIISSLLYLQSGYIEDEHAQEIFRESQNRIKSMALIHENLYQTKNLTKIDLRGYITNLVDYLLQIYVIDPTDVAFKLNIAEMVLDIDTVIPCGLIITELVTNALKHTSTTRSAGSPGQTIEIWINLQADSNGQITLIVGNNGPDLPENLDLYQPNTLGLQLVTNLVKQLKGSIEFDCNDGTAFIIRFQPLTAI